MQPQSRSSAVSPNRRHWSTPVTDFHRQASSGLTVEVNTKTFEIMNLYTSNLENKRVDLFEGPGEGFAEENVLLASNMTNQQLMDQGNQMMDETDQAFLMARLGLEIMICHKELWKLVIVGVLIRMYL
ncbi:novel plant SNARE 11, partial [Olea europaea subsp. europaea]